jgi:hypothetical protein
LDPLKKHFWKSSQKYLGQSEPRAVILDFESPPKKEQLFFRTPRATLMARLVISNEVDLQKKVLKKSQQTRGGGSHVGF